MANNMFKWVLFNSIVLFVIGYLVRFHDGFNYFIHADATMIGSGIVALYAMLSLVIGYLIYQSKQISAGLIALSSTMFVMIGLAGTVIGMMQSLGVLELYDPKNLQPVVQAFGAHAKGAPICTVTGIIVSMLTILQACLIRNDFEAVE
ncbi:hypothetical protein EVB91_122 [Rhizobium phage RHph_I1_18]|nr:hypothetical protein EVB91_122 [Rhizobium phage RHph_I1_18]